MVIQRNKAILSLYTDKQDLHELDQCRQTVSVYPLTVVRITINNYFINWGSQSIY